MGFFDFEHAERDERALKPIQGRGDTLHALIDHRWLSFAIIVFLIAVIFRVRELLAMVAFMIAVISVAFLWSRQSLRGITYHRQFRYRRYFPGEEFTIHILIENRKLLPVPWIRIEDEWPLAIGPKDETLIARTDSGADQGYLINTYALRWYERIRRAFQHLALQRGVFTVGPVHLVSGDPFSLFDRKITLADRHEVVIVYPRIRALSELGLPLKNPFGDQRVQRRLFEDPNRTMGVRDYAPYDSFRHIHWKATARMGQLQTRVYEPTRSQCTVLCLNVATFEQYWRGVWPAMLEYEMEVAASLANWGIEQGHLVGMVANSTLAHADQPFRILPSRNPDQLARVLQALAAVSYFVSAPFERFILQESPRMPWGATLVVITPFVNDALAGSLLRLHDSGRRIVLISLSKSKPPRIGTILTYHLPVAADEPPLPDEDVDETKSTEVYASLTPRQRYLLRRAKEGNNDAR